LKPGRFGPLLLLVVLAVVAVAAFAVLSHQKESPEAGITCGEERWPVKTLSDRDAARVNLTPVSGSVAGLRALPTPSRRPANSRVAPVELTTYSLTARVIEFKIEEDRDVHLVIGDPTDPAATMIVEFPDASDCKGAVGSVEADLMRRARGDLLAAFGQPGAAGFRPLQGYAALSGVGFFDLLHGQRGVAPNGIELHPVLHIERTEPP
jgi:hypothetical protein